MVARLDLTYFGVSLMAGLGLWKLVVGDLGLSITNRGLESLFSSAEYFRSRFGYAGIWPLFIQQSHLCPKKQTF